MSDEELDKLLNKTLNLKVLYVEDNKDTRLQSLKMLEDFFIDVVSAENGKNALDSYDKNTFDIIITDLNMPVMDGIEMTKEIRKTDKDIPVIVISAHNEKYIINSINTCDIQAFIFKPLDLDEFIEALYKIYFNTEL